MDMGLRVDHLTTRSLTYLGIFLPARASSCTLARGLTGPRHVVIGPSCMCGICARITVSDAWHTLSTGRQWRSIGPRWAELDCPQPARNLTRGMLNSRPPP